MLPGQELVVMGERLQCFHLAAQFDLRAPDLHWIGIAGFASLQQYIARELGDCR